MLCMSDAERRIKAALDAEWEKPVRESTQQIAARLVDEIYNPNGDITNPERRIGGLIVVDD